MGPPFGASPAVFFFFQILLKNYGFFGTPNGSGLAENLIGRRLSFRYPCIFPLNFHNCCIYSSCNFLYFLINCYYY